MRRKSSFLDKTCFFILVSDEETLAISGVLPFSPDYERKQKGKGETWKKSLLEEWI